MRLFTDASERVKDAWLRRAYVLAEHGRGLVSPNPVVGCVLVRDGQVVGEGYHTQIGAPHAEVEALSAAGPNARTATAYVTLEPCTHHGRTPPCTDALIRAGVSRVVIGMRDPNPEVSGQGAERLRAADIGVEFADDPSPFVEQNEAWLTWVKTGSPWVRVKLAATLDGHAGLVHDRRCRMTGPEAALITARLRANSDAVCVGASTLRADDPLLTVRDPDGTTAARQPLRVVLARTTVPRASHVVFRGDSGPSMLLVSEVAADNVSQLTEAGVQVERYPYAEGLRGALRLLGQRDITSVLIEAGPGLFSAAVDGDVIDELVVYHAGGFGGNAAPALFAGSGETAEGCLVRRYRAVEAGTAGEDAVTVWRSRSRSAD